VGNLLTIKLGWKKLFTCIPTPWSTDLLEKLISFQLVKKFPAFYWTSVFTTAFKTVRHLSLSWASSIHFIPTRIHFLMIHLNIILPSTPGSSRRRWEVSPPKPCIHLSSPPYALHAQPISFFSILGWNVLELLIFGIE